MTEHKNDILLKNGYYYRPVVENGVKIECKIFESYILKIKSSNDRLASNYTLSQIYERMAEYGYVYDCHPNNIVMMVGIENFGNNIYRAGSRTYVDPNYRSKYFSSPDNLEVTELQIKKYKSSAQMIFESRDRKNPGTFKKFIKDNANIFRDWKIHYKKIELKYKGNFQWIMYWGDSSCIDKIIYAAKPKILHYTPFLYEKDQKNFFGGMQNSIYKLISGLTNYDHYVISKYGENSNLSISIFNNKNDEFCDNHHEIEKKSWSEAVELFNPDLIIIHGWWNNYFEVSKNIPIIRYNHLLPQYVDFKHLENDDSRVFYYCVSNRSKNISDTHLNKVTTGWAYPTYLNTTTIKEPVSNIVSVSRLDSSKNCKNVIDWFDDGILFAPSNFESVLEENICHELLDHPRVILDLPQEEIFDKCSSAYCAFVNVHRYENFSIALYEMASLGLPIITNYTDISHPVEEGILEPWMYKIVKTEEEAKSAYEHFKQFSIIERKKIQDCVLNFLNKGAVMKKWNSILTYHLSDVQ
jgi:hypothetical protein